MSPGKRNPRKLSREERRENALRPDPHLGYDSDSLGVYLLSREAYEIAESQFRRAVWLNPFEVAFKAHLAWCLYRQERYAEAHECAAQALMQKDEPAVREILELAARRLTVPEGSQEQEGIS
jgi:tetratricopeptide (TPR) repeat protein